MLCCVLLHMMSAQTKFNFQTKKKQKTNNNGLCWFYVDVLCRSRPIDKSQATDFILWPPFFQLFDIHFELNRNSNIFDRIQCSLNLLCVSYFFYCFCCCSFPLYSIHCLRIHQMAYIWHTHTRDRILKKKFVFLERNWNRFKITCLHSQYRSVFN